MAPPGIEERYHPAGPRSPHPLVVAVGRLVPVKRFDLLVDALVKRTIPEDAYAEQWKTEELKSEVIVSVCKLKSR